MNTETTNSNKKRSVVSFLQTTAGAWTSVILIMLFYAINPAFLNNANIKNLLNNISIMLVMACGATLVRLSGSLDLSMGAVCSVADVIFVMTLPKLGLGSYPLTLAFGIVAGFMLGALHTKLKIPSFIASLGFMNIWKSVALFITDTPVSISKQYQWMIGWGKMYFGVIGFSTLFAFLVLIITHFFQTRTVYGRSLTYIGGNERAARLGGVPVDRYKIMAFTLCGLTSSICGIMAAAKLKSGLPTVGDSYTLQAVAAVLLGGTSASGGRGSVIRSLFGVIIVILIHNGMTIIGVNAYWCQVVFGAMILFSMILTADRSRGRATVK